MAKKFKIAGLDLPNKNIETNSEGELITVGSPSIVSFDASDFTTQFMPLGSSLSASFDVYEKDYIIYAKMSLNITILGAAIGSNNIKIKIPKELFPLPESMIETTLVTVSSPVVEVPLRFTVFDGNDDNTHIELLTYYATGINNVINKTLNIGATFSFPKLIV
jgi:hypothetical protein